jgi:NNMT/PNMT/TEMT family
MVDREPSIRNDAIQWSDFDADEYWKITYASILPEDAEIIQCASKFLLEACGEPARLKQAVDVGAGTNLYPALLMLPWAERIVLTEYASPNIDWLSQNLADAPGEWPWRPFWDLVADLPCYRTVDDPRRMLAAGHEVRTLSIFDLPRREWDLGSMFFVADGMTTDQAEFEAAVRAFLDALLPGSPFLMAFMEGSEGYDVRGLQFPSVKLTLRSLDALLDRLPVTGASVLRTDNSVRRLRTGYDAMLLVTGFVATGSQ